MTLCRGNMDDKNAVITDDLESGTIFEEDRNNSDKDKIISDIFPDDPIEDFMTYSYIMSPSEINDNELSTIDEDIPTIPDGQCTTQGDIPAKPDADTYIQIPDPVRNSEPLDLSKPQLDEEKRSDHSSNYQDSNIRSFGKQSDDYRKRQTALSKTEASKTIQEPVGKPKSRSSCITVPNTLQIGRKLSRVRNQMSRPTRFPIGSNGYRRCAPKIAGFSSDHSFNAPYNSILDETKIFAGERNTSGSNLFTRNYLPCPDEKHTDITTYRGKMSHPFINRAIVQKTENVCLKQCCHIPHSGQIRNGFESGSSPIYSYYTSRNESLTASSVNFPRRRQSTQFISERSNYAVTMNQCITEMTYPEEIIRHSRPLPVSKDNMIMLGDESDKTSTHTSINKNTQRTPNFGKTEKSVFEKFLIDYNERKIQLLHEMMKNYHGNTEPYQN